MFTRVFTAGVITLAALIVPAAPAAAATPTVLFGGLNNPRGLAFGPDDALYVAEAGTGGDLGCFGSPEGEGEHCFGLTGSLTRYDYGKQTRVLTGLPSHASPDGSGAIGPSDVSFGLKGYLTIGLGTDPAVRGQLPAGGDRMGKLFSFQPGSQPALDEKADLAAYEAANDPDGGPHDSNPQGVLALPGGKTIVVDAGANDLLKVGGTVKTLAVFADHDGTDAVPTAVAWHHGAFYVSELTGFPFTPGTANIYRLVPGKAPVIFASGLTNVIDLALGDDGSLYALEIAHNGLLGQQPSGALLKLQPGKAPETVLSGLMMPGGLTIHHGFAYITDCGVCAGGGSVLRVKL